jgi:UDP-arabinose 4-epimerase
MSVVIVTGGAGYIGSHTTKALYLAGFTPVTVDNLSRGHEWAVKWGPLERTDIVDQAGLESVFKRHRPAAVLHFAALAYVGESVADPYRYYRNNVAGTLSLLEVMRAAGCDKIVFSSTCATYGIPDITPIVEAAPQRPVNPYGASKLMVERVLADADTAYGLRSICLRYFNAAGSDPQVEIGEAHEPETHVIPLALRAAAGTGPALSVFGGDYDTPDGTCIRDYIHVSDLASAHVLALQWLLAGKPSRAFNLGTEQGHSVLEMIRTVETVCGCKVPFQMSPRRLGDPPILVASAKRARQELGWVAQFPSLENQVADAWRWMMRNATN